jgi:hypothetical protein
MFYHVSITQNIDLEPMYFGPKLRETIRLKITDKVRSTTFCYGALDMTAADSCMLAGGRHLQRQAWLYHCSAHSG